MGQCIACCEEKELLRDEFCNGCSQSMDEVASIDDLIIDYARKNGFWIAMREFDIKDKDEWKRLQKLV